MVILCTFIGLTEFLTDPLASPTGFPFKILSLDGTVSEQAVYEQRQRVCDLGFLRQAYRRRDGKIGWRCPGEKVAAYTQKGGEVGDTVGRKCICNGLLSTVGYAQQTRDGRHEPSLVTCGNGVSSITQFLASSGVTRYSAADVVERLLSKADSQTVAMT